MRTYRTVAVLAVACGMFIGAARVAGASGRPPGPGEGQLADAVTLGTVATLAPLCGLRDDRWSEDLRRATMQSATGTAATDDPGLRAAPGSQLAMGALSFAEAEALEDFAGAPPDASCRPLAANPDLARADGVVRAFRRQKNPSPGS